MKETLGIIQEFFRGKVKEKNTFYGMIFKQSNVRFTWDKLTKFMHYCIIKKQCFFNTVNCLLLSAKKQRPYFFKKPSLENTLKNIKEKIANLIKILYNK